MQTRNYILFLVLSMAILIGWERFVLPHILPKPAAKNVVMNTRIEESASTYRPCVR